MGISFTEEQQQVIKLHDRNLLVAAAAGSGKTAVLVERIISMISNQDKPIDIDRLLIVTFTSAAASEMRERISSGIQKRLETEPENEHLQKQVTLIHNAQITTIDSFCLFVIRNNFNDIGLDPTFRVVDEGELKLLKKEVLSEVLEQYFEEGTKEFYHFVECYSANGKEKALEEYIMQLYHYSMSYPFPEKWLLQCKDHYQISTLEELEMVPWIEQFKIEMKRIVADCISQLQKAIILAMEESGPYMYLELLQEEEQMLVLFQKKETLQDMFMAYNQISFGRLSSKKDDKISKVKRESVKAIRTSVKETISSYQEKFFVFSPQQVLLDMKECKKTVSVFVDITMKFSRQLQEKKRERNVIDFTDMEHLALSILVEEKENIMVSTQTAKDYQHYFHEILIDEYQDSNMVQEYLLKSISKEEMGSFNRFMVGDVKQSIYKFRLARPEIFMEKYDTYTIEDSTLQKINLHKNFRSRKEVIESVNYIFYQIMQKKLGNVIYDDVAALHLGASFQEGTNYKTEFVLCKPDEDSGRSDREIEALFIAGKIKQLKETMNVTDHKTGLLRPVRYSDIAILLRSTSGWGDEFKKVLQREGIPVFITSKTGYFSAIEVQTILNFLKVLDNPLQDIPLFGLLKSPIGNFNEEEIACIKITKKGKLYDALQEAKETIGSEKIIAILDLISRFRDQVPCTPIHEIICDLLRETKYRSIVGAMSDGQQRAANIDVLLEKALAFEHTSFQGLFHFVKYIEQLEKFDVDYGEANILDEKSDTVRMMTIHKSKGLEFPICFVAGLSKGFNMMDLRKGIVMDIDMGIGVGVIDPIARTKGETLHKNVIAHKMKMDLLGEELRILYVAMTRAKEKLILCGVAKHIEKKLLNYTNLLYENQEELPFVTLLEAGSYLDFIIPALIRHRGFEGVLADYDIFSNDKNPMYGKGPNISIELLSEKKLEQPIKKVQIQQQVLKEKLLRSTVEHHIDPGLYQQLKTRFLFKYPYTYLENMYTKTTVSELKRKKIQEVEESVLLIKEEQQEVYVPHFRKEEVAVSGASRGTAYHKILELVTIDQVKTLEDVKKQMKGFLEEKRIPQEYAAMVNPKKILLFCQSSLAKRMSIAKENQRLFREQPFVLGLPANVVSNEFPKEETILMQGIIDAYFEEDGEIVLVDYKTDRISNKEELEARYSVQLNYYGSALEQLTGKKVKEKIMYSFALESEVIVK